jgi:hypothetical protein
MCPNASASALTLSPALGSWIAPSNVTWSAYVHEDNLYRRNPSVNSGERHIAVYFPRTLPLQNGTVRIYYEEPPDWYSTTIPGMAIPADLHGEQVYTVTHGNMQYPLLPACDESINSFPDWIKTLPTAEKRLVSSIVHDQPDAELLLLDFLMSDCVMHVGTDGGKKHHAGSFSWILCDPDQKHLISNSGPVDGWHRCQSSLRSEAATVASFTLFIDEFAC